MIKLYALKGNGGYIKNDKVQGCIFVPIEKASVYNKNNLQEINVIIRNAKQKGIEDVKIVELNVTEKMHLDKEKELMQNLSEMLSIDYEDLEVVRRKWEEILIEKLKLIGESGFVDLAEKVRRYKKF